MRNAFRNTAGIVAGAAALILTLSACSAQNPAIGPTESPSSEASSEATPAAAEAALTADLLDATGASLGTVSVSDAGGALEMRVEVDGMPPGFHAFHVHAIGLCEPDSPDPADPALVGDFLSAGGHLGADVSNHGTHTGDQPSLFVEADGTGLLVVRSDAVTLEDLVDADGSAVMVHAGLDNFANIPERYAPAGPDQETLNTGDSGGRIACAAVTE